MKRMLLPLLSAIVATTALQAQERAFTIDRTEGNYTVNSIVAGEESTLLLCTYTVPIDEMSLTFKWCK